MAIEITGRTNSPTPIKSPPKAEVSGGKESAAANTEKVDSDSVAVTITSQEIKKAFGSSSSTLPVDVDRVNSVKKALADGSYSINAEKVAKKLIQFEQLISQENST